MIKILLIILALIIIPTRPEVQAGDVFSITLTYFEASQGAVVPLPPQLHYVGGDATRDGNTLTFPPVEETPRTLYATFRAQGPGDVTFPGGRVVRITGKWRVFVPVWR